MESILEKLQDGGILITYPILVLLFVIIALFIIALVKNKNINKTKSLIASIGWFVLAWGYLGRTIGLIEAFDNIAAAGEITPRLLSGGLKMAIIGPLMGLFTFVVARVQVIVFILMQKEESTKQV